MTEELYIERNNGIEKLSVEEAKNMKMEMMELDDSALENVVGGYEIDAKKALYSTPYEAAERARELWQVGKVYHTIFFGLKAVATGTGCRKHKEGYYSVVYYQYVNGTPGPHDQHYVGYVGIFL